MALDFNQKIQTEGPGFPLYFVLKYEVLQNRWEHSYLLKKKNVFPVNDYKLPSILESKTWSLAKGDFALLETFVDMSANIFYYIDLK